MSNSIAEHPVDRTADDQDNATYFRIDDAPRDKQDIYERLRRFNSGSWISRNRVNESKQWERDRLAIFDAIAGQLELTDHQRSIGREVFGEIRFGDSFVSIETFAFAVCASVANDDVRPQYPGSTLYLPSKTDADNPDRFVSLQHDLDLNSESIGTALRTVYDYRRENGI
jgi:hypothetical protein